MYLLGDTPFCLLPIWGDDDGVAPNRRCLIPFYSSEGYGCDVACLAGLMAGLCQERHIAE